MQAGSVSGTFGTLLNTNLPANFTDNLSYDATNVYLNLVMGPPTTAGPLTVNQQNVSNALINSFNVNGGIPAIFGSLTADGLTQLSGEVAAFFSQPAFQAGNSFLNLMLDRFLGERFGNGGFGPVGFAAEERPALPAAAAAFASAMPAQAPASDARYSIWGSAFGGSGRIDGDAIVGSHSTTSQIYGFAAGTDFLVTPNAVAGLALAGGGTHWSLSQGLGSGRSNMFQAGVYAKARWDAAYFAGALAYSFHEVTTNRTVAIAGADTLEGKFRANVFGGRLESGYRFAAPWAGVTPYGAVQVQSIALPSYGESATFSGCRSQYVTAARSPSPGRRR